MKSDNQAATKSLDNMQRTNTKLEKCVGQLKDEISQSDDKIKALQYAVTYSTAQIELLTSKNQDVEAQLSSWKR